MMLIAIKSTDATIRNELTDSNRFQNTASGYAWAKTSYDA